MMSLVAYGSDSSGDEDNEMEVDTNPEVNSKKVEEKPTLSSSSSSTSATLLKFSNIPKPQPVEASQQAEEDEDPIPLKKVDYGEELEKPPGKDRPSSFGNLLRAQKVGGRMMISVPSLKDFDGDEALSSTKKNKIIQPASKKSGLFAILPEPKVSDFGFVKSSKPNKAVDEDEDDQSFTQGTSSTVTDAENPSKAKAKSPFVPHVVQQTLLGKRPTASKLDEIKAKYLRQEANIQIVSRNNNKAKPQEGSDDEDASDFFSFSAADEEIPVDPSLRLPDYVPAAPSATMDTAEEADYDEGESVPETSSSAESVMQYLPHGKKSKKSEINFIDVRADDLKPDSMEWVKNITAEDPVPRQSRDAPGGMTKRKHQITYLAFQAKEREQTLKAQWAENRHNKRSTQSKYGF